MSTAGGHYFDPAPGSRSAPSTVPLRARGLDLTLRTDRGVFSPGRVDPGTTLLLDRAGAVPRSGDLLDLGCGYGPLAVAMAHEAPDATVWAVEVNERARALCAENAERLGLANLRVCEPGEVPDEVRFAAIWSNPPIRVGKAVLHDLLTQWLGRLTAGASATLVVARNLGADSLHTWLEGGGYEVERIASKRGYRLLVATRG